MVIPPRILPKAFVFGKNLSLEMLRAGWVTTYEQVSSRRCFTNLQMTSDVLISR